MFLFFIYLPNKLFHQGIYITFNVNILFNSFVKSFQTLKYKSIFEDAFFILPLCVMFLFLETLKRLYLRNFRDSRPLFLHRLHPTFLAMNVSKISTHGIASFSFPICVLIVQTFPSEK